MESFNKTTFGVDRWKVGLHEQLQKMQIDDACFRSVHNQVVRTLPEGWLTRGSLSLISEEEVTVTRRDFNPQTRIGNTHRASIVIFEEVNTTLLDLGDS